MSIRTTKQNVGRTLYEAGFTDLVSVISPGANLSANSKIKPQMLGKIPGKKGPGGWYGYDFVKSPPTSLDEVKKWDEWGANIGMMGTRFPALDIDVEDAILSQQITALALDHFGPAPVRLSREPRRLMVYRTDTPFPKMRLSWAEHAVEFLGEGRQFLVAGTHPSGNEYSWSKGMPMDGYRAEDLVLITPEQVEVFFDKLKAALEGQGFEVRVSGRTTQSAPAPAQESLEAPSISRLEEVVAKIPNPAGNGWDDMVRIGYAIKAAGGDEASDVFYEWCARWEGEYNPDVDAANWHSFHGPFRAGWSWLCEQAGANTAQDDFDIVPGAVPPQDPAVANPRLARLHELNRTYAVVQVGSDVVILQEREDGEVVFMNKTHFQLKLANREVPSATSVGKTQLLANAWLAWAGRREYERAVFRPGAEALPPTEYNLWSGWAVCPSEDGSCEMFLQHVRTVVCCDHGDLSEFLLDWLAQLFQFPQKKIGIAVALKGGQGAGKSIVGDVLKQLLGHYQIVADKPDQIVGQFNSQLRRCLLLQSEEAFWGGKKTGASALKHLVTGKTLRVEQKGIDSEEVESYLRLLITTNEDLVWPTSVDDRRLAMFEVSDHRVGDRRYFDELFAELDDGGYEKLLHTLLTRQIDHKRLEFAPRTAALEAQAAESMTPEEAWLLDLLERGEIQGKVAENGSVRVALATLYDEYEQSLAQRRFKKPQNAFAVFITRHLQAEKAGPREYVDTGLRTGARSSVYTLPPLPNLRAGYSARGRGASQDWDETGTWIEVGLHLIPAAFTIPVPATPESALESAEESHASR
jgi:hypothetical protein